MDLKELKITDTNHARHPWELARIEVIYSLLKSYCPELLRKDATIVDIGCGDLFLIEQLSYKIPNWKFYAVDTAFEEELLHYYRNKLKGTSIKVFNSLKSAYENMEDKVDIVLLLDVIEHIENDVNFLYELKMSSEISNETVFLITVPAFQSLFCSHDFFLAHYRRYDNNLLSDNITKSGLVPLQMGYFFFLLVFLRMIEVFIEKIFGNKEKKTKGIGGWKGNSLKDRIIKKILILDFKSTHLLRKYGVKICGLSNYVICKKLV